MKLSVTASLAVVAATTLPGAAAAKNLRVGNGAAFDSGEFLGEREESDDDPYKGDNAGVRDERELLSSDVEDLDSFNGNTEEEEGDNGEPVLPDGRELKRRKKKQGRKKKSGIDIDWELDRAYLYGEDVEAAVSVGHPPAYTFEEEPGTQSQNTGTDGATLERQWSEAGVSHRRGLFFKTYPAQSGNADSLQEVKMRDNHKNWIWWKDPSGQFYQQENMIVIPDFYDGFYCDKALFTFHKSHGGRVKGTFLAYDFTFANELYPNYDPAYLRLFNPCEHIRESSKAEYGCENGKTCTCSVEDSVVSCNGQVVPYSEIYADMAITVKSADGPVGGRAPHGHKKKHKKHKKHCNKKCHHGHCKRNCK